MACEINIAQLAVKTGLTSSTILTLQQAFSAYAEIEKAVLYGSRAKGNFHQRSDIDIALYGQHIDNKLIAHLLLELDDSDIIWQIDLQNYQQIKNQTLQEHIDRIGLPIYSI